MTPLTRMREHRYHLPLHCPLSSRRSTGHRYQGAHRLDHRAADTKPPALQRRVTISHSHSPSPALSRQSIVRGVHGGGGTVLLGVGIDTA